LQCKQDCDFDQFIGTPSSFSNNLTFFAEFVVNNLNPDVSCTTSVLADYLKIPESASDLVSNLGENYFFSFQNLLFIIKKFENILFKVLLVYLHQVYWEISLLAIVF
jgi:hypothetical protein